MTAEGERVLIETGCASGVCLPLSDHAMFKGATMRHLGYLRRFAEHGCKGSGSCMRRVARLRDFASSNAESCWWHAREERLLYQRSGAPRTRQLFDNDWRGPYAVDSTGEIDSSLSLPAQLSRSQPGPAWLAVATSQIAALALFASLLDDGAGSAPPAAHRHPPPSHVDGRLRELAWAALLLACVAAAGAAVVCYRRKRGGGAAAALLDGGLNDPAAAGGTSPDPRPRLL